ncbi:nitrilase family protein [Flavobacteriaceae bacterium 3-367]|uniref:nitrilase family protein n=1 Tax=Eudoraea algarum TaxID=3417568 RepID=UPI00328A4985
MHIAVAQFEPKDGDKSYNLSVMEQLAQKAKLEGADVISFHEMCITAYTFSKDLTLEELSNLAEVVPDGDSTQQLIEISSKYDIAILAGLVEKEGNVIYNTYLCVTKDGVIAKYRKLHPFISEFMSPGDRYVVFDLLGWKCGILICYDNNVIENVRATALLGAEVIFAPHVTCCTPSAMPGRGYVDHKFWENRFQDPEALRSEFDGPKGRGWLMRWLPARAYDNGVYYVFTNPIGYDGEHLKNGNSMVIDPFGDVLTETKSFDDTIALSKISKDKIPLSGGWRYKNARRPHLYKSIIGKPHQPELKPIWMLSKT